jgi:hypothetical protein
MRKIQKNVSSVDNELQPCQAKPLTSQYTHAHFAGWSLIHPICFIAIIPNAFTG